MIRYVLHCEGELWSVDRVEHEKSGRLAMTVLNKVIHCIFQEAQ